MRRAEREIKDQAGLELVLDSCTVCRLAMQDEAGLFILPLNFGYEYQEGRLVLYFHSAKAGRKVNTMSDPSRLISFEMDCGHSLVEGETACQYTYSYQSIVGSGYSHMVEELEEKKHGLEVLMRHIAGKEFTFTDIEADAVAVFQLTVEEYTGKRH